jgi:CheY-like chemotaxis protein
VDYLLAVARISNGMVGLQVLDTTARSVVTNAMEIANAAIVEKGHELLVDQPASEYRLRADHVRVVQSLANLLVNAAKFTPRAGTIRLAVQVEGPQVEFRVCDNGRGLAAESLGTIFEMFAQARSPGEPGTGLGIGLNLAKRFAELHGGTLAARSEGLGRGSEFVLRLPVVTGAEPPAVKDGDVPVGPVRLPARVLVVDDNVDAANTLGTLLTLQGISVALAYDGAEAVEAVQKQPPDVVLMDIGMPRLNGYDAARQIRRQPGGGGIRLIALTGWGQYADRHLAEQAGFDVHFVKPVDFAALLGCLASPG